ncbi:hypothetical protein Mucpa_5397 [Mucilaginibacter paludis DSM 18603]|uniref:Uncharacterized protein n=1 Tax=Mucilaginibacter paludis DSM 18603 TaxID=714943 RepID=H1Y991_9SPHI|nr:hypothetical protein Mucpa_5397 [Mucilaginibacter paludis DSM 18603]
MIFPAEDRSVTAFENKSMFDYSVTNSSLPLNEINKLAQLI